MNFSTKMRYLKSVAAKMDVKVTVRTNGNVPTIYIRDFEFSTFEKALTFLKHIAESEMVCGSNETN